MLRPPIMAAALLTLSATTAAAQVPVTPQPLPKCEHLAVNVDLRTISTAYVGGNWIEIDRIFRNIVPSLRTCIGQGEQWIVFVWPGENALGDTVLFSVVYPGVTPFSGVLPGLTSTDRPGPGLYEVFLAENSGATLRSAYVITREEDPLQAQVAAALEKNLEKILGGVGTVVGFAGGRTADLARATSSVASVFSVGLPFERGKIVVKRRAVVPRPLEDLVEEARKLAHDASIREGRDSPPARALADAHVTKVNSALTRAACSGSKATPQDCQGEMATLMSGDYQTRFNQAAEADRPALAAVDKRFRDYVAAMSGTKIDQDSALINEPKTYFSLATVVGYIGTLWKETVRVKVSSNTGALIEDPLPRVLTAVGVNWSPAGFQASDPSTPGAERFRVFSGVAVTPNFGWVLGGSVQAFSGFTLNGGLALLALPTGELGSIPETSDPFQTDWAWAPFVGAGFSWK